MDGEPGRDAAAAWYAESVARFFCSTHGGGIASVRVNKESFIVVTATVPGNDVIDVRIAVASDGTCACRVSGPDGHRASAAPEARSFEELLKSRLAEIGVPGRDVGDRN